MTSTLPLKQHVEFLSHVTEPLLGVFWLVWQGVDKMSKLLLFMLHQPLDWFSFNPNLKAGGVLAFQNFKPL
jgi:hypothetical protein